MIGKANQHNQHAGPPVDVHPVYGDDLPDEDSDNADGEQKTDSVLASSRPPQSVEAETRILSWNISAVVRATEECNFLEAPILDADIACLQEVTRAALEWLTDVLGKTFA